MRYTKTASKWDILESHIYMTTSYVIKTLHTLKNNMIKWLSDR